MSSYNFKVVLLGQSCVGKTSLVLRYISNVFNDSHQSTLQTSFLKKQLYLDQDLVKLNVWDTAGQEKFHALGPIYYREANGALLVYDVTSRDSLRKVRDWVVELNKMLGVENVQLTIVGNKLDLLTSAELENPESNPLIHEAIQFSNELRNAGHYLTSAKLNVGMAELFVSLSKRMIEQTKRQQRDRGSIGYYCSRIQRSLSISDETNSEEICRRRWLARPASLVDMSASGRGQKRSAGSSCQSSCWK